MEVVKCVLKAVADVAQEIPVRNAEEDTVWSMDSAYKHANSLALTVQKTTHQAAHLASVAII